MWSKVERVRSGMKVNFGDDSSQYEMVGGTRASERDPRTPASPEPPPPPTPPNPDM